MNLGKRTTYALMLTLICFNVLIRLPRSDHETGVDSFFIHSLADSISEEGRAAWIINPLGYFGWYPLSYPGAGPFLISGVALTHGISEEPAILLLSLTYGALSALLAFVLARAFRPDDAFAFTVALIFSLAPVFTSFTLWTASTRNLFMVLTPAFLWALLRSYRKPTAANLVVFVSVFVVVMATHRLTILLAIVILAFVVAFVLVLTHRVMRVRFPRSLLSPAFRRWAPRLALGTILAISAFMIFGTAVLSEYSEGQICQGETMDAQLCNLGVSMTRNVGLALPLAVVGIFAIVRERGKGFLHSFLVLSMLALVPTLFLRQYTGVYVLPFLALLAGFGVCWILPVLARRPRVRNATFVACLVAISGFSAAVMQVEVDRASVMSEANYTTGLYVRALPDGNLVSNDGLLAIRVFSIADRHGLPLGGASTTFQGPELLIMGAIDPSTVFGNVTQIGLTQLTVESDSPFELRGVDANRDWEQKIFDRPVDGVSPTIVDDYRLQYFLENIELRSYYYAWGKIRSRPQFADSVHAYRYKIYSGPTEDLYLAFPPIRPP